MQKIMVYLVLSMMFFSGCGQKRGLYLPKPVKVPEQPASQQQKQNDGGANPEGL